MARLRIDLGYDGAQLHGWATQPGLRTVQGDLESALGVILRRERVGTTCAGRTDAGVHARGQVVHTDVDAAALAAVVGRSADLPEVVLARRLNAVLPVDIRVFGVRQVPAAFDARFGALWRRYRYRIADHPAAADPLLRRQVLPWRRPLDAAAMGRAAAGLLGEHDFAAYCRRRPGATSVRTLLDYRWVRETSGLLIGEVRADAFCHSMVRSLVGAVIAVGEGRRPEDWPAQVLHRGVRDSGVLVVPAHGLCLEEVAYPPDEGLAEQSARARVLRVPPGQEGAR